MTYSWRGKVRKCSKVFIPGFAPVEWWEGVVYRNDAVLDDAGWPVPSSLTRPVHAEGVDWARVLRETLRMLGLDHQPTERQETRRG